MVLCCATRFEMAQKPAFVLNVTVAGGAVDLNLAPDKREVLMPAEGAILGTIRYNTKTQHNIVQYSAIIQYTILYSTLLYSIPYCTLVLYIMLYLITSHYVLLCSVMLCYVQMR